MRPLNSLLRFVVRLQGAVVEGGRIDRENKSVEIRVRRRSNAKARCPECGGVLSGTIRSHRKRWRHLDLIRTVTYVSCDIRVGYCSKHGQRVERVPWAHPGARHTKLFDLSVSSLVQVGNKSAAARMFGVSWRTVGRVVKRVVTERLGSDRLDGLTWIGIDETSYKRGHRYITTVCNLETGHVVWVGEGKSGATLERFFKVLGERRAKQLDLVCIDMSDAYARVIKEKAPQADIAYDKFHVVKLLLEAIDEVRREECRTLEGEQKKALKGMRYAFLRNPKHRGPKDLEAINRVQSLNAKLARAYQLRVDFEDLWDISDEDEARGFLMCWTRSALLSRRQPLRRFAKTVRAHMDGILSYFRYGNPTNATLEGTNNKIKLIIHKAFGFHSVEALMAMVYLCCTDMNLGL
jgi:transposase